MLTPALSALVLIAAAAAPAHAADPVRTETVTFAPGASSRVLKGSVTGYGSVNYVVKARAGQTMTVALKTSNASNNFNVMAPGADTALFVGSTSGARFTGKLPTTGAYTVQVYLMRSAARRNESANYTLTLAVSH